MNAELFLDRSGAGLPAGHRGTVIDGGGAVSIEHSSSINHPIENVFAWHGRSGAFLRLAPPWQPARLIEEAGSRCPRRSRRYARGRMRQPADRTGATRVARVPLPATVARGLSPPPVGSPSTSVVTGTSAGNAVGGAGRRSSAGPTVLVAGGSGYVGARLIRALLDAECEVHCLARTPAKVKDALWRGRVHFVRRRCRWRS